MRLRRCAAAARTVGEGEKPQETKVAASQTTLCVPEDLQLAPGEMSTVDRVGKQYDFDVFRCFGCTKQECQGSSGCAETLWRFKSDGYLREVLTARVYDVAIQTPLEEAKKLSEELGNTILLKREDLQPVFSFKLRGAYNKMSKLTKEQLDKGVITSSAGNHAQGVSLAASKMVRARTPEIKVASVRKLGGIVELVGETYQETQAYAAARSVEDGLVFIPPYDDPYTIAGQGTIGDEILGQVSNINDVEAIFVPIGGGGLIAGIGAFLKALKPDIKIIGVEPTGANAMALSLQMGERIALTRVDSFADGVAVKQVGMETFRICQEVVDGVILVDNQAISAAIKDVFNETRSILEPAGAVGVAGAKAWLKKNNLKGKTVVAITSGANMNFERLQLVAELAGGKTVVAITSGANMNFERLRLVAELAGGKTVVAITSGANMNFERLRLVAELAGVGALKEAMLTTSLAESPGAFKDFIKAASGDSSINVTEFKYRFAAGDSAQILWGASVSDQNDLESLIARLDDAGMKTSDISKMEVAQLHMRHLVGGRARSYMGLIPDEKIFQIIFPEKLGALSSFLDAVSPRWNITLFHYRATGNRESSVLIGVQVPAHDEQTFIETANSLPGFVFKQLDEETKAIFQHFIQ
eukprot:gene19886-26590_t